jgi:hypothetical protein
VPEDCTIPAIELGNGRSTRQLEKVAVTLAAAPGPIVTEQEVDAPEPVQAGIPAGPLAPTKLEVGEGV